MPTVIMARIIGFNEAPAEDGGKRAATVWDMPPILALQ